MKNFMSRNGLILLTGLLVVGLSPNVFSMEAPDEGFKAAGAAVASSATAQSVARLSELRQTPYHRRTEAQLTEITSIRATLPEGHPDKEGRGGHGRWRAQQGTMTEEDRTAHRAAWQKHRADRDEERKNWTDEQWVEWDKDRATRHEGRRGGGRWRAQREAGMTTEEKATWEKRRSERDAKVTAAKARIAAQEQAQKEAEEEAARQEAQRAQAAQIARLRRSKL